MRAPNFNVDFCGERGRGDGLGWSCTGGTSAWGRDNPEWRRLRVESAWDGVCWSLEWIQREAKLARGEVGFERSEPGVELPKRQCQTEKYGN